MKTNLKSFYMENKSTLNKKLKSYSALAGTLVAASTAANAQVIYTDVTPDATTATGASYGLDLNNDGTVDFQMGLTHGTYMYGTMAINYDYAVIAPTATTSAIDTLGGPKVHVAGDSIQATNLWEDGAAASYQLLGLAFAAPFSAYSQGNFLGVTDKYIGLRFQISGANHYGWVRIDLNSAATSLVVKDYAYNGTVDHFSICGQTTDVGINEILSSNVNIYSADNSIYVNMNKANVEGSIVVTDVLGKTVATAAISNTNMVIPMNEVTTGIYFVTVSQGDARFTKKVIVK